MYRLDLLY